MGKIFKNSNSILLSVIIILGVALKLIATNRIELNNDEIFSIYHSQLSVMDIFKELSTGNNPPLFETLLHFWIKLFGIQEHIVRIPSIIFSIVSTFYLYKLTYFITENEKIGLTSSLLFSLSGYFISLEIETRAYSLMVMLVILNSYSFLQLVRKSKSIKWLCLWAVFSALGYYTHFFTIWITIVQVCFLLFHNKSIKLKYFFIGLGISALLFLPYLPTLIFRFKDTENSGTWVEPANFKSIYFIIWQYCNSPIATVIFILGFIGFTYYSYKYSNQYFQYLSIWFWIPFILMFLISLQHKLSIPMFIERYVCFVFPAFFIGISIFSFEISKFQKSQFSKYLPILPILILLVGLKIKTNKNLFSDLKECKNIPKTVIIQPYYGSFSYLYFNDRKLFQEVGNGNLYNHMENQLLKKNIFSTRPHSLNNFIGSDTILFIKGELSRQEEIEITERYIKSNKYKLSGKFSLEGKNYTTEVYSR